MDQLVQLALPEPTEQMEQLDQPGLLVLEQQVQPDLQVLPGLPALPVQVVPTHKYSSMMPLI